MSTVDVVGCIVLVLAVIGFATDRLSITSPADRARRRNRADLRVALRRGRS